MEKVPYIITGKDLDYLSDMFNWNYSAFKCMNDALCCVEDDNIKSMIKKSIDLFNNNMNLVLDIIGGKCD